MFPFFLQRYSKSSTLPMASAPLRKLATDIQRKSTASVCKNIVIENDAGLRELSRRKHGSISVLMSNRRKEAYDMLVNFSWEDACVEAAEKLPTFFYITTLLDLNIYHETSPNMVFKLK